MLMTALYAVRRVTRPILVLLLLGILLGAPNPARADRASSLSGPDLFFEGNVGQFPESVEYIARGPGYHIIIDERGATHDLGALDGELQIRLLMSGGRTPEAIVASEPLPGRINYYLGNDPQQWVTNAPTWRRVELRQVYGGVDVAYYGRGARAEFDFLVAPGADPAQIQLTFEGADGVRLDDRGRLVLRSGEHELLMSPPVAYQEHAGGRRAVEVAFALSDEGRIGFRLGRYDPARKLVIDPVILEYSTSLGGSAAD